MLYIAQKVANKYKLVFWIHCNMNKLSIRRWEVREPDVPLGTRNSLFWVQWLKFVCLAYLFFCVWGNSFGWLTLSGQIAGKERVKLLPAHHFSAQTEKEQDARYSVYVALMDLYTFHYELRQGLYYKIQQTNKFIKICYKLILSTEYKMHKWTVCACYKLALFL